MFDVGTAIYLALTEVEMKAHAEGRQATKEEYKEATQKTWNACMNASVDRDMTRAGFIKTETGWQSPRRRGFFARLFG